MVEHMDKKQLYNAVHHLSSAYTSNEFIGIHKEKNGLVLYIQDDSRLVSLARFECKNNLTSDCMVFTEAMKAAIDQFKGKDITITEEGEHLRLGNAELAKRDVDEMTLISGMDGAGMKQLSPAICNLITTQFDTFITSKPSTVFGWSMFIENGVAWFGSANGPTAIYGSASIDEDDMEIRIPHEAAVRIAKIMPGIQKIWIGKQSLRLDRDSATYFIPSEDDTPSLSLDNVFDLIGKHVETSNAYLENVYTDLQALMRFADSESQVIVTIDKGTMIAKVSGKVGSNQVELCKFTNPKLNLNFRIQTSQISHLLTKEPVKIDLAFRDNVPLCLVTTEKQPPKKGDTYKRGYIKRIISVSR
jgi:hypothetical protein